MLFPSRGKQRIGAKEPTGIREGMGGKRGRSCYFLFGFFEVAGVEGRLKKRFG